jgi:hypothetical protein
MLFVWRTGNSFRRFEEMLQEKKIDSGFEH